MLHFTMGDTIAALRKERGLTQKELAERMHVTDKAVSKWERSLSCPDVASLPALAEALGTSVDELLQHPAEKKSAGSARQLADQILRCIPLAMGVAVTVSAILDQLDLRSGFTMLGIGLFSISLLLIQNEDYNIKFPF